MIAAVKPLAASPPASAAPAVGEWKFAATTAVIFAAASTFNVAEHVLWRDELRWWEIAEASPSFAAMRANMRFEGVPWLWYGLLWLLSRLTSNVFAMQLLHVAIATATVFLFAWRAPFARAVRVLFPLGYFPFFEYAVISRNYALALLWIVAATALIARPRARPVALAGVLLLLTQTSIWGAGLAGMLFLAAVVEWSWLRPPPTRTPLGRMTLVGGAVFVGGVACYLVSLPGPGASFIARWPDDWSFEWRVAGTLGTIWYGWMPIPLPVRHFWNTNILQDYIEIRCAAGCLLWLTAALFCLQRPAALAMLVGGSAGLLSFTLFQFVGATRHSGLLFMVLISACWLAATTTRVAAPWPVVARCAQACERRRNLLLGGLLAVHAVCGVAIVIADHVLPFSAGKQAAEFIVREVPADTLLVGFDDYTASAIGYYADRPIYSLEMDALPDFHSQDDAARSNVPGGKLVERVAAVRERYQSDVVVILNPHRNRQLATWRARHPDAPPWVFLARFDDSTIVDERAFLYRVAERPPGEATPDEAED